MGRHRAPSNNKGKALLAIAISTVLVSMTFAFSTGTTPKAAVADSGLSPLEIAQINKANCETLFADAVDSAQEARALLCINDQTRIIELLSPPTATPTVEPTATSTVTPTTAPPTTTTTTVPPTTTNPPTTTTPPVTTTTTTTTTTPPPTTTSPPTTGCLSNPSACGFPDATNTGATGTLTVVTGDVLITTNGTVYENKDVRGCIEVRASNVLIRNVKVTCGQNFGATIEHNAGSNLTVQDSTLDCNWHGNSATGIWGDHTRAYRNNIRGCENGFDIYNDWIVESNFIHDLYDAGDAHTDGAQVVATGGSGAPGGNIVFNHNTWMVSGVTTSAIIADHCACTNLTITNNLISGAPNSTTSSGPAYMIYCPRASATSTGVSVSGNRFGLLGPKAANGNQQSPWGYGSNCGRFPWTNNRSDATGALVTP